MSYAKGLRGIITPMEYKSQWCNTWSLATRHWDLMIGFGNKLSPPKVFHRCKQILYLCYESGHDCQEIF